MHPTEMYSCFVVFLGGNGVFTLAVSGTGMGIGTGTSIMQNISHYTGTGTGEITGKTLFTCPK